ncbi:hypothetical protein KDW_44480 [Dictyobacter vulcani]|uniref:Peptidase S9 prolyl oligopeptidase catalytic domain-containing protein n=1 Tax=Dictyobacter vulcani TaxID=2607529 RepID=A0A5J4KYQ2_9CHLR|nr:prolyl oligopeptidase family serine peptidase [Dictyobacter vulcani]GER90286.1 hypothetical protein KDW_44480 [Dictyobacter vulcani]
MLDPTFFVYDNESTPDIQLVSQRRRGNVTVKDILYTSPQGGYVPAYLLVPFGDGPFAGLIFVHWGQGDRTEFLEEAITLAEIGILSLCIDAPFLRPAKLRAPIASKTAARDLGLQIVADVRRGVDVLMAQPGLDSQRIGFVGHSYGATNGGIVAGIEKRIKTYVLMAGYAATSQVYRVSTHPMIAEQRKKTPPAGWERYLDLIEPLDAIYYIGNTAPASLLFQFAHQDEFVTEEQAQLFFETASKPKQLRWYDSSHELNAQARIDRATWLCQELNLGPLPASVQAKLS